MLDNYWSAFRETVRTEYVFIREMGGRQQEWRITITGSRIRETWTDGKEVLSDDKSWLGRRTLSLWFVSRHAELFAVGWRLAAVDANAQKSIARRLPARP